MAATALRNLTRPVLQTLSTPAPSLTSTLLTKASQRGTPLTVRELYAFGERALSHPATRLHSAQFLHNELPIRLAHRACELTELPHGLASMPSVRAVKRMYETSFTEIVTSDVPDTVEKEREFSDMLFKIRRRHDDVVKLMATGVLELKKSLNRDAITSDIQLRAFLDRFFMSRIGIRVLMSHHLALGDRRENMAGVINRQCSPLKMIERAVDAARSLCYYHYGESAEVEVRGKTDLTFPYIDDHIFICLFELVKNSLRATVETHADSNTELPPVRIIIADGKEDVTIKISDEGGGLSRSAMKQVWTYMYTTAKIPASTLLLGSPNSSGRGDPIAGFGYGLPLSRLYARYWGGELGLTSMEGYGTDAYLYLSKLGDKKESLTAHGL